MNCTQRHLVDKDILNFSIDLVFGIWNINKTILKTLSKFFKIFLHEFITNLVSKPKSAVDTFIQCVT